MQVYETVLYATEVPAASTFYTDVLGLRLIEEMRDGSRVFRLDDGGVLLIFDPAQSSRPGRPVPSHGTAGPGHVAFSVGEEGLEEWSQRLRRHGVDVEREISWPLGGRSIYFRDPAGNSVELIEGEAWP